MASIKFGNVVVDARGKISGNVYSKNKGGAYSRVRVVPNNPQTTYQVAKRAILTTLSQGWRGLTAAQRLSWTRAVDNYKRINRIGDQIVLSGNALYVSLNKNLADVGIAANSVAPAPESVDTLDVTSIVASLAGQTLVLTMGGAVPTNTSVKVFGTETLSAGVNSPGTKLRQFTSLAAAATSPVSLDTTYIPRFGAIGAAGSKIFITLVPVNETTGQLGAPIKVEVVISA